MNVVRIAAFSDGSVGGNPAGVAIGQSMPPETEMQAIAAAVGYSETAFAMPMGDAWRVRYFSPESEVPFCGHATIALGSELAGMNGDGIFRLQLNNDEISVEGSKAGDVMQAALQSPGTSSAPADDALVSEALALFGYSKRDLDSRIPPAVARAGATHLVLALNSRKKLAAMEYSLAEGRELMNREGLVTISLLFAESDRLFHARNAFASGGVLEDPATGAAAAALGGYLRDLNWPHGGEINIIQGEDMGMRSLLNIQIPAAPGSSIRVSGAARVMEGAESDLPKH
jgi:PhzF family phenazine biosynthesis protein